MDDHDHALPWLRGALPAAFRRWEVVVAPGAVRPYESDEWTGAVVVVESGAVDLICREGTRTRLTAGAVGFLAGLPLRELHNPGADPAVLVAVARRTDEFRPPPPSHPAKRNAPEHPDHRSPRP